MDGKTRIFDPRTHKYVCMYLASIKNTDTKKQRSNPLLEQFRYLAMEKHKSLIRN